MKKILLVIPSLGGGGAEKIAVSLINYLTQVKEPSGYQLNRDKYEIVLVLFNQLIQHRLPSDIKIINLEKKSKYDVFKLIRRLKKIIRQENPTLILSFLTYTNLICILSNFLIKKKLILIEQNNLTYNLKSEKFSWLKKKLVKFLYPLSNLIVCCSKGVRDDLIKNFSLPLSKIKVIYNGIDFDEIERKSLIPVAHPWFISKKEPIIITAGRLTMQKGQSLLLESFALLNKKVPARLVILGEGEERENLENLANNLGIKDKVCLLGFQENPYQYISKADIFVLSSFWEGFAIVIVESFACGTPVISTRAPYGPEEIISDGENGFLVKVGNKKELAEKIILLLNNSNLRTKFINEAKKRCNDFSLEKMVKEYEKIF